MKKALCCLLVLLGCFGLFGCGGDQVDDTAADNTDAAAADTEAAAEVQQAEFHGVTFEVPADWEKVADESNPDVVYYSTGTDFLLLQYSNVQDSVVDNADDFLKGMESEFDNFSVSNQEVINVGGTDCLHFEFTGASEGTEYAGNCISVNVPDGLVSIGMYDSDNDGDYSSIFQAVLDSIQIAQ